METPNQSEYRIRFTASAQGFPSDSDPYSLAERVGALEDFDKQALDLPDTYYDIDDISWDGNELIINLTLHTSATKESVETLATSLPNGYITQKGA